MSNAYQRAQNNMGVFSVKSVSVGDLFLGALLPGMIICLFFLVYTILSNKNLKQFNHNKETGSILSLVSTLLPPILLIFMVLGSIILGIATPTEAAAIGAFGSLLIAAYSKKLDIKLFLESSKKTALVTTMVFTILIGASIFSLIFRGVGGDELINLIFDLIPGGKYSALLFVMLMIFFLGFILDFIEICYVFVPLIAPPLLMMGFDPVWLGVLLAINLQTSFLTPPFGFSLFYLRGVADSSIQTSEIYKGVLPFIAIQLFVLFLVALFPLLVL